MSEAVCWPIKRDIFGVQVSVTHYEQVKRLVVDAAKLRKGGAVTFLPVHGIVTGATNAEYRRQINSFEMICPDGQPVRWALNRFHNAGLSERVYGPETMLRVCELAAKENVSVYLYGSTAQVLESLSNKLKDNYPALNIVGLESPPFRKLSEAEQSEAIDRINASGAGIVFIGLGCPRQEAFAASHRAEIKAVQLCVGAAFDFHAGNKPMAPAFLQRHGLEWLFRLCKEPRRLWKRYFVTNSIFVMLFARQSMRQMMSRATA